MPEENSLDEDLLRKILSMPENLGPGSEELSSRIDEILYGTDSSSRKTDTPGQRPKQVD